MKDNIINIDYLRFSLTDRCNLNCIYCTPLKKSQFLSRDEVLSYEEIVEVAKVFVKTGIRNLRLTGGEPLIKKGLAGLVKMLRSINGLKEISMTTNGVMLKDLAADLKKSGLDRINISLDTLKKEKFRRITGLDHFGDVWAGIKAALRAGLHPVKLNVILMKGINDDEILDFTGLVLRYPLVVRFIEFFPTNRRSNNLSGSLVETDFVKKKIRDCYGELEAVSGIKGNGPAEYYRLKDSQGTIGFISNASRDFCNDCNRVRVDCAGRVSPCLFSGHIYDMRPALRDKNNEKLFSDIKGILSSKSGYNKKKLADCCGIEMSSIGG